jgi:hypothetical protein
MSGGGGVEPLHLTIPVVSAIAALGLIFVIRGIYFKRRRTAAFAGRHGGLPAVSLASGVSYRRINAQPNGLRQSNPVAGSSNNFNAQRPTPGRLNGSNPYNSYGPNGRR